MQAHSAQKRALTATPHARCLPGHWTTADDGWRMPTTWLCWMFRDCRSHNADSMGFVPQPTQDGGVCMAGAHSTGTGTDQRNTSGRISAHLATCKRDGMNEFDGMHAHGAPQGRAMPKNSRRANCRLNAKGAYICHVHADRPRALIYLQFCMQGSEIQPTMPPCCVHAPHSHAAATALQQRACTCNVN